MPMYGVLLQGHFYPPALNITACRLGVTSALWVLPDRCTFRHNYHIVGDRLSLDTCNLNLPRV